jgi:hypothetical protein
MWDGMWHEWDLVRVECRHLKHRSHQSSVIELADAAAAYYFVRFIEA